jgi:hypothetical protein
MTPQAPLYPRGGAAHSMRYPSLHAALHQDGHNDERDVIAIPTISKQHQLLRLSERRVIELPLNDSLERHRRFDKQETLTAAQPNRAAILRTEAINLVGHIPGPWERHEPRR